MKYLQPGPVMNLLSVERPQCWIFALSFLSFYACSSIDLKILKQVYIESRCSI